MCQNPKAILNPKKNLHGKRKTSRPPSYPVVLKRLERWVGSRIFIYAFDELGFGFEVGPEGMHRLFERLIVQGPHSRLLV